MVFSILKGLHGSKVEEKVNFRGKLDDKISYQNVPMSVGRTVKMLQKRPQLVISIEKAN